MTIIVISGYRTNGIAFILKRTSEPRKYAENTADGKTAPTRDERSNFHKRQQTSSPSTINPSTPIDKSRTDNKQWTTDNNKALAATREQLKCAVSALRMQNRERANYIQGNSNKTRSGELSMDGPGRSLDGLSRYFNDVLMAIDGL